MLGGNKRVIFLVFKGYEATSPSLCLAGCANWRACWQPELRGTGLVQVNLLVSARLTVRARDGWGIQAFSFFTQGCTAALKSVPVENNRDAFILIQSSVFFLNLPSAI